MRQITLYLFAAIFAVVAFSCSEGDDDPRYQRQEAIDLGLSVKWASQNLGAPVPEGHGAYYAWADTTGTVTGLDGIVISYNASTGITSVDWESELYGGVSPAASICGTLSDVARRTWDGTWRLPTAEEMRELVTRCSWQPETLNNVSGWRVTGPNGNSIFLPMCEERIGDNSVPAALYWSGTLLTLDEQTQNGIQSDTRCAAWALNAANKALQPEIRCYRIAIRPVTK